MSFASPKIQRTSKYRYDILPASVSYSGPFPLKLQIRFKILTDICGGGGASKLSTHTFCNCCVVHVKSWNCIVL